MEISRDTVDRYARMARLSFSDPESDQMGTELGAILEYVQQIADLDLSEVKDTDNFFGVVLPRREDVKRPSLPEETALDNGPEVESGHFLVPKVIKR